MQHDLKVFNKRHFDRSNHVVADAGDSSASSADDSVHGKERRLPGDHDCRGHRNKALL